MCYVPFRFVILGSSATAESAMIVTQPWFIAAIIVCVGGAIWLAVCAVVVWLSRCRRRRRQTNKCVVNGNHRGKEFNNGEQDFVYLQ